MLLNSTKRTYIVAHEGWGGGGGAENHLLTEGPLGCTIKQLSSGTEGTLPIDFNLRKTVALLILGGRC